MNSEKTMLEDDELKSHSSEKERASEDNRSTKDTMLSNGGTDQLVKRTIESVDEAIAMGGNYGFF